MMEVGAKYRIVASICALVAAISAFGRWQLDRVGASSNRLNVGLSQPTVAKIPPTPKLPAPSFLKYSAMTLPEFDGIDLADNGALLTVSVDPTNQNRTYSFFGPDQNRKTLSPVKAETRYSMSQSGRLFEFLTSPPIFGFPRRAGYRVTMSDLAYGSTSLMWTNRRLLNDGVMIGFQFGAKDETTIWLSKQGKPVRTILRTKDQPVIGEVDDKEMIWIWNVRRQGTQLKHQLHRVNQTTTTEITLPAIAGSPKVITTTRDVSMLTVHTTDRESRNRVFRLQSGSWKETMPPPGSSSMIIQKITNDGLMFGGLQFDASTFIPAVWKDGVAYDLRRHPEWPIGGQESYVELANRQGDLIVTSVGLGGEADMVTTILRRLPSK
jgi:hypothetical protein